MPYFDCIEAGNRIWEVIKLRKTYVVSLSDSSCSCNEWNLTRIPCVHATTTIVNDNKEPSDFVHDWYTVNSYKMIFQHVIFLIPDDSGWGQDAEISHSQDIDTSSNPNIGSLDGGRDHGKEYQMVQLSLLIHKWPQHSLPTKMWTTSRNNSASTSADTLIGSVTRHKKVGVDISTIDIASGSGVQIVVAASRIARSSVNTNAMGKVQRLQTRSEVHLFSSRGSSNNGNQTKTTKQP
ncbi:hypothetical protein ACH5RR_027195 [Cinchona calisaya]|uniref:SWIM-type domain-containing protein n=1 Tax=Cinchona calisaya TaxID=153742 RepID=A0ABD2Z5R9_9GENT